MQTTVKIGNTKRNGKIQEKKQQQKDEDTEKKWETSTGKVVSELTEPIEPSRAIRANRANQSQNQMDGWVMDGRCMVNG